LFTDSQLYHNIYRLAEKWTNKFVVNLFSKIFQEQNGIFLLRVVKGVGYRFIFSFTIFKNFKKYAIVIGAQYDFFK